MFNFVAESERGDFCQLIKWRISIISNIGGMKICAYMAICLSLPFALLADEAETGETETAPEEGAAVSTAAQAEGFQR